MQKYHPNQQTVRPSRSGAVHKTIKRTPEQMKLEAAQKLRAERPHSYNPGPMRSYSEGQLPKFKLETAPPLPGRQAVRSPAFNSKFGTVLQETQTPAPKIDIKLSVATPASREALKQKAQTMKYEDLPPGRVDPMVLAITANNKIQQLVRELTPMQISCQRVVDDTLPRAKGGFFSSLFRRHKRSRSMPTVPESERLKKMGCLVEITAMLKRLRVASNDLTEAIATSHNDEHRSLRGSDPYFAKLIEGAGLLIAEMKRTL